MVTVEGEELISSQHCIEKSEISIYKTKYSIQIFYLNQSDTACYDMLSLIYFVAARIRSQSSNNLSCAWTCYATFLPFIFVMHLPGERAICAPCLRCPAAE